MFSNAFANALLKLIYNGMPIAGLADNAAAAPLGSLYMSLHTADPGPDGGQSTSEVAYTGYTRVAVARGSAGFTINGAVMDPAAEVAFPMMTGGAPQTATYMCLGTAANGAGMVLARFAIDAPYIALNVNVQPHMRSTTSLTFVTS